MSNTTLEPQLENTHEMPQSSRDEGLPLLYGLDGLRPQGPCRVGTGESGLVLSEEGNPAGPQHPSPPLPQTPQSGPPELRARGEGERVMALQSWERTRASRGVEEGSLVGYSPWGCKESDD